MQAEARGGRLGRLWQGLAPEVRLLLPVATALALLAAQAPAAAQALLIPWSLVNGAWFCWVAGWGVLHLRTTVAGVPAALHWALAFSLATAVLGTSGLQLALAEQLGLNIPSGLLVVGGVVLFGLVLPLAWIWGMCGMALGLRGSAGQPPARAIEMGLGAWWTVTLVGLVLALPDPDGALAPWGLALLLGTPLLAHGLLRVFRRRDVTLRGLLEGAVALLDRRLVWRRRDGRRRDLRGPAVGAWAALAALAAAAAGLFAAPAAEALAAGIRFRNEPFTVGGFSLHWVLSMADRRARERLAVVQLDPVARRAALRETSEAALQARAVTALSRWGARAIVLPVPTLRSLDGLAVLAGMAPDDAAVARCRRDLPALAAAMRRAGNVILVMPTGGVETTASIRASGAVLTADPVAPTRDGLDLRAAAAGRAVATLEPVGSMRLPTVPLDWEGDPPLALAAASWALGRPGAVRPLEGRGAEVAGRVLPGLRGRRLVVDFLGAGAGLEVPTVPYSDVLAGVPIAPAGHFALGQKDGPVGEWLPPERYFRDRVVFLDPLIPQLRDTPVGPLGAWEVHAAATATAIRGGGLREPPGWLAVAWTLAIGMFTGAACAGRNPVPACWRTLAVLVGVWVASTVALRFGIWLDVVVPAAAALGALVLATQLNVTEERRQRERNRALLSRFASPQVVEELLDDPDFVPGLGGRRQQVVVLFADARGFTSFAERHSPEVVIEVTNAYLTAFTDVVHQEGGILDKYTGDGLMALFLVRDTPAAAVRCALRAALRMQEAARRVSESLGGEGEPLVFGIGLHCGDAIVGFVGNPDRLDYTALGHTVVVSQRLQSIAGAGEVVVSETVAGLAPGATRMAPGEPVQVKGLSAAVVPYRLHGPPAAAPAAAEPGGEPRGILQ